MSLRDIQGYVTRHGRVTLTDLCLRFDSAPEAMRPMLARLISKGRIEQHLAEGPCACCGSAGSCQSGEYFTTAKAPPVHTKREEV